MMQCGLLGRKLAHSYSPQIHSMLAGYPYALFEKEPEALEDFLRGGSFTGLNVTVPYKKDVIPYLDRLTDTARRLGAVNTVVRQNGMLIGHNTDYFGFETMLRSTGLQVHGKKALVLGSGGASNTVTAVLRDQGAEAIVISRNGPENYGNLHRHLDARLIVNTTPVGMYPHNGSSPISLDGFEALEGVLDVVYNPARTQLLMDAQSRGIVTANGLLMLVAQAWESAQWFSGQTLDPALIPKIHGVLAQQMENIILIGMPGCGKSTLGQLLADLTGRPFVDADRHLEMTAGRSIPEIIQTQGTDAFRTLETATLQELGKQSGLIIATGGGCVTREENYPLLRQNGRVIWLERDIRLLPTQGRPLSQAGPLSEMYALRKPMYQKFANYKIDNNGSAEATAARIMEVLK